tara:strand:- start:34 stop:393 length:360 start_codon:yes stop_codon:yes gene_type:complete
MAHQALVHKGSGQILEFVEGSESVRFEVHEDFKWVEGPATIEEGLQPPDYYYNLETEVIEKVQYGETPYDLARRFEYPSVEDQLDVLFHDMEAGRIPGKDTSVWYSGIKRIKDANPKPE